MEEELKIVKYEKKEEKLYINQNIIIIILLINIFPVILANFAKKSSVGVSNTVIIAVYSIQLCILLFYFFKNRLKIDSITKKYIIIWSSGILVLLLVQLFNYIFSTMNLQDIMNILSKYATVLLLIIFMLSAQIKKDNINKIYKFIFWLGIIACTYNMIYYFNEIANLINIQSSYSVNIKSFFANRNQFAQFLVIAVISTIFLVRNEKKFRYKLAIILFLVNILFTMSRTAILSIGVFLIIIYMGGKRIKQNIIICISGICIVSMSIFILYKINPIILENVNKLFIRTENLDDASGRANIWKEGINIGNANIIFGIGRFKGIDILQEKGMEFTQFHNIFIESYVSGGIFEVFVLLYLIISLFINFINNKFIDANRKICYIASLISFIIIGIFESCNRFSIGYVDTLFTLFFVTIPILEINYYKNMEIDNI